MRALVLSGLALLPFPAFCQVVVDNYCFELSEQSPVKFELRTYYDAASDWSAGYVKYAKSSVPISIVVSDTQDEESGADRPLQTSTTWVEIVDGRVAGEYRMVSQGTQLVSMTYDKKPGGRHFDFTNNTNIDVSLEKGCQW